MTSTADTIARRAAKALNIPVPQAVSISGGDICDAARLELPGGRAFAKTRDGAAPGFFATEAAGLRWLGEAGPVPDVLAVSDDVLVLSWHEPGPPTRAAAEQFGRDLAGVHAAGAAAFGAMPPGADHAFTGSLRLPLRERATAAEFLADRLATAAAAASGRAGLTERDRKAVEALAPALPDLLGPDEPPARLHGDLWAGNVHWTADGRAMLIDPAAHGGHRETDIAMLYLFGAPHLAAIVQGYQQVSPLAGGWEDRLALHQLSPLLVHAALFGGGYGPRAGDVARRYLPAAPRGPAAPVDHAESVEFRPRKD